MAIARFTGKRVPGFDNGGEILADDGRRFVASSIDLTFGLKGHPQVSVKETLVFNLVGDTNSVTDWVEVAGGKNMTQDEALADLNRRLAKGQ